MTIMLNVPAMPGRVRAAIDVLESQIQYFERLVLDLLEIFEAEHGPVHEQVAATLHNLANEALQLERHADALRFANRALAIHRELGDDGEDPILAWIFVARARRGLADHDAAMAAWHEAIALRHATTPDDDDAIGWAELETGITANRAGRHAVAREHMARALEHYGRSGGQTRPRERARAELEAAMLSTDPDAAAAHLRRAWQQLGEVHEIGDAARRLEVISTWSDLGGPAFVPWSAIGGDQPPLGTSR